MRFIDTMGLTQSVDGEAFADTLGLEGERVTTEEGRLRLLRRLQRGAGVEVVSGPVGVSFWSLSSPEVKIRIEPDGEEYNKRVPLEQWIFVAAGGTLTEARSLADRDTPPTERHSLRGVYERGQRYLAAYNLIEAEPLIVSEFEVEVIHGEKNQVRFLNGISEFVALDWEWNEDDYKPIGLAVSDARRNWYLPVRYANYSGAHGEALRTAFSNLLDRGNPCVFHQAKADLQTQYPGNLLDLVGKPIDDTIVMAYLAGESELGLKPLTEKLLGRIPTHYPGPLDNVPLDMAARYACADTRNTYDLYQYFIRVAGTVSTAYEDSERPLVPILASMEKSGSPIALDEVRRLQQEYHYTEEGIRSFAWQRWRKDISNDKETRLLVTDLLGYDPGTLDQRVLSRVQDPWMDVILGYRKLRTVRRNYLDKYLKRDGAVVGAEHAILRASFNQAGSSDTLTGRSFKRAPRTGRLSSARPNLMQVPREIRTMFVPPEGCAYWALDFSQLELRIAAGLSEDPAMLAEINRPGGDIHTLMQNRIQEKIGLTVDRHVAKTANFNLRYGGSADMLVTILAKERMFLDPAVAQAIVDLDKTLYSGYWEWYARTLAAARDSGFSSTLYGRRVYYGDLLSPDSYLRGHAERAAVNLAVQGSASDIVKKAMVQSVPLLKYFGGHIAIQVHDELAGFIEEENAEKFIGGMKAIMESIEVPNVKLKVEGWFGNNWAEAKG